MKCPKTDTGKHNMKVTLKKGNKFYGKETQHRRCQLCGYQERYEEIDSTGRWHWVPVGG